MVHARLEKKTQQSKSKKKKNRVLNPTFTFTASTAQGARPFVLLVLYGVEVLLCVSVCCFFFCVLSLLNNKQDRSRNEHLFVAICFVSLSLLSSHSAVYSYALGLSAPDLQNSGGVKAKSVMVNRVEIESLDRKQGYVR